ncbi:uncharacterized protein BDZ99DRAFT_459338 [Mytilinidion resinicola]|uniref:Uncharacterized protein n=1 Tax=Mytilinidion resinicola TaxID=574789 RepID=A0A6A6Z424_9PEZI|nr:uncharacterized protein BDZ99DRAFT_459338 [Mytilinidion resinicola]KAF2815489.1 hypothetical protein BDZ99DRAFT_459338 [Mytilinidion resinicola]
MPFERFLSLFAEDWLRRHEAAIPRETNASISYHINAIIRNSRVSNPRKDAPVNIRSASASRSN